MATDGESYTVEEAYETVVAASERILNLEKTDFMLRWDSDVMMPEGGAPARASQRSAVHAAQSHYRTTDELGAVLDRLAGIDLSEEQAAVVREVAREYDVETSVPPEVNERISTVTSGAHETWKQAKDAEDWSQFAPTMGDVVDAWLDWADCVAPDVDPFETLWSKRSGYHAQRYIDLETVETIFDDLREGLVPLIEDIGTSDAGLATDAFTAHGPYDPADQHRLCKSALDAVGLDWDRARLDTATHPFSYGTQYDVRVTTRFDEATPLSGLSSVLHEFGHTAYTHGLPQEYYGTPLGEPRGLGVHESQSRFFENHVGRSEAFWEFFLPTMREQFQQLDDVTARDAYEAANQIAADNTIRVNADELTYHLHIILRTEIERGVVAGDLDIADVPGVWAEKLQSYLGVRPESDADGPLQDPHWTNQIPAFITYTIGSVLAAQLAAAMEEDLGSLGDMVRDGDFDPIHEWLTEHVHRHGQQYRTDELIRRATGEDLTADYFLAYAKKKYSDLYGL